MRAWILRFLALWQEGIEKGGVRDSRSGIRHGAEFWRVFFLIQGFCLD
jgi:hypothetical protein